MHFSQQSVWVHYVFENLFRIDEIERTGFERNIHSVKRTKLCIIAPARPYFWRLFNIKADPRDRWIDRAKVINAPASSATEIQYPLNLPVFVRQQLKIVLGRDLAAMIVR